MLKKDVKIGGVYEAKISGKLVHVQITDHPLYTGKYWQATNLSTGRTVTIKSAQKLRREITND